MKKALPFVVVLAIVTSPLFAAEARPPGDTPSRVAALLDQLPALEPAKAESLSAALLALGPEGLAEVASRVLAPGQGDDSRARFAVSGLAAHVTRPGAEAERRVLVRSLLDALGKARDPQVAAFFLSQVQLVGREESVRPVERYLVDEALAGPATAALLAIGGPAAPKAMIKALPRAPRGARLALVQALGQARSREAVPALLPFAEAADETLRQAALFALANIGDPAAGPVLSRSRVAASRRERSRAPALYLLYARRLVEAGRTPPGLEAARGVLEHYRQPGESQHAAAALDLVVSTLGAAALPDLLAAVDTADRAFRGSALAFADRIPGTEATGRWVETARAAPPAVRADVVAMLGRRGDATALPFVRACLRAPEPNVRLAAIPAAARMGRDEVLQDLLPLLDAAGEAERAALKAALLGYSREHVAPEALRLLDGASPAAKAVLVEVLGAKGAREAIAPVLALARDADPVIREASLRALGQLAADEDLPRLVTMLEETTDGADVVRLREAIASAVLRNPDRERRADGLLGLMRDAPPARKVAILKVLPRVGGDEALGAVVRETGSADAEVQAEALSALVRWPEITAAPELLRVARETPNPERFRSAVQGYVRLVARSNRPVHETLGNLEGLLARSAEGVDRAAVLAGIAGVRQPESLRLLARLLDGPELGEAAAKGLLDLASRQSPREPWLSGHEAYSVLRRVEARLADPAARARAAKTIADRLRQGGFVPLFDGRSLDGWKGLVADPPKRAKMTPDELARAQAAADETMRTHWKVEDGVLVFDGKGESLCTGRDYGDFELLVDWKIGKDGDSGIYLRGSPQVQIWDAEANPVGSGGLFNNEKAPKDPLERADRPVGEWNSFRIVMIGERVTVYLNDRRVVDHAVLENYWERDRPIDDSGAIELQAHGNPLWFRNLWVREISRDTAVATITAGEVSEGFTPLFNGRDLEGWTGGGGGYAAEDGKIVVHPERGGGNLYTEKEYSDFVLRFEFRLTPAANNGLGVRAPLEGDAAYAGMEIQFLEDGSPVYWGLQPYQYHGSIYGVVPARRGVLRPVGEWNREEVTVKGRHVTVEVNGTTVVDADLDEASAGGTMDGKDHPGLGRTSGRIGFLGHGSALEIRNIRLRELR